MLAGEVYNLPGRLIRLDWKGLPVTNALDYNENLQLTAVKRFITLSTGVHPVRVPPGREDED